MVAITDDVGAFVPGPRAERAPLVSGRLSGLTFAVKDLFDLAGVVTTFGNPDWASTHPPAVASAPVVLALLLAGGRLAGKTKTQELAYGLTGENVWHGTPINPAAPDRFPGGSSCGSAAAVAASLVDFALGSDTGGSVRIPASYCGLFGIRPTLRGGQPGRRLSPGAQLRHMRLVCPLGFDAVRGRRGSAGRRRAGRPAGRCCVPRRCG